MERRPKFDWHPSPRRPRSPSSVTSSSSSFSSRLPSFSSDAGDSFVTAEDCFEEDERESSVSSNEAIAGGYGGRSKVQFVVPTTTRLAWWRRKLLYYLPNVPEEYRLETHSGVLRRFSLRELHVATDNFSLNNQLGRGGSGIVYKGQLADGSLVAVKRLKEDIGAEQFQKEFISLKHKNLLILQGFCMTRTGRFLVYPYMANRSLADQLRGRLPTEPPLDWPTRIQIALGSARGLSYLHDHCDPKIIHRNVKASQILLDEEFEAVLGHFEWAEYIDCKDTHVTTTVCGTIGFIAPEYFLTGECSEKTDVFGYGIMLLELITGQRTFDLARLAKDDNACLLDWVKGLLEDKRLDMLVDPELQDNYIKAEVEFVVQLAILCSQDSPMGRPKMSEVVRILEGEDLTERWKERKKKAEGWNNWKKALMEIQFMYIVGEDLTERRKKCKKALMEIEGEDLTERREKWKYLEALVEIEEEDLKALVEIEGEDLTERREKWKYLKALVEIEEDLKALVEIEGEDLTERREEWKAKAEAVIMHLI